MRRRLIDAAAQLLAAGRPVSTAAIADVANVSIGTVYRYFNNRDEILQLLLDAAVRDIVNSLTVSVSTALELAPEPAALAVVESLTTAFERHAAILRATPAGQGSDLDLAQDIERMLFPLARVIPARLRGDLTPAELDDLVFVTMGFTASGCLRIALQRDPGSNRGALIATTARMLAAALTPPVTLR